MTKPKNAFGLLSLTICLAMSSPVNAEDTGGTGPTGGGGGEATNWAAIKAAYEAQTAAYNAAKAAAEARNQSIVAQQTADLASLGKVTGQDKITGDVAVSTGAGGAESSLLVAQSLKKAAAAMAETIGNKLDCAAGTQPASCAPLMLLTGSGDITLGDLNAYNLQRQRLEIQLGTALRACNNALRLPTQASGSTGTNNRIGFLTAAGGIADLASKLGSYFQTNYAYGPVSVTTPGGLEPALIAEALAIQKSKAGMVKRQTVVPGLILATDVSSILAELKPLSENYEALANVGAEAKLRAEQLKASNPPVSAALSAAAALADKAIAGYDSFGSALVTNPAGVTGAPPIERIVRQRKIRDGLANGSLVLNVTVQNAGGYYTKKNLWTFLLPVQPFYLMGGTTLAYTLSDPNTGAILASGAVPKHGGYHSVSTVAKKFR